MPVRIVHTITKLELGGAQQNTLYTLNNLTDDYEGYLVCGMGGYLAREAENSSKFKVAFCPPLKRKINPLNDWKAYRWMVKYFKELKPDILHSHSSKAGILSRWAAKKAGVPVIIHTFHGFGFTPLQPWFVRIFFIWLEKITAKISTKLIFVSHSNMEKARNLKIGEEEQYMVIRSGIDIGSFSLPYLRTDGHNTGKEFFGFIKKVDKVVGNVSCFKPQKGLHDYVESCRCLKDKGNYGFVLVGDGKLREKLEKQVEEAGLQGLFQFFGWAADTAPIIAVFDIMLHTAYFEGLPRVILEAMALAKPIVATNVDGVTDVIENGISGYLVEPGDIDAMVEYAHELLQDDEKKEKMGKAGRERLEKELDKEFDIKEMSKTLNNLYNVLYIK